MDGPVNRPVNANPPIQQPTSKKLPIVPIIVVAVLVIAIVIMVIFAMGGNGGGDTAQNNGSNSTSASGSEGQSSPTVKFTKPDNWGDKINVYVYNDAGEENAKWPGVEMTSEGNGTYSYTIPDNLKDGLVVFNDGENQYPEKEQKGLAISDGKSYSVEDIVINFTKPDSWGDDINVYVYQEGVEILKNADWPGEPMSKNSDGTYSYTIKAGTFKTSKLVFNDGKGKNQYPKSGGLVTENGKMYTVEQ